MKIRIYSPFYPYPVSEGAFQVIYAQALELARLHDVELVVWKTGPALKLMDSSSGRLRIVDWSKFSGPESKLKRLLRLLKSFFSQDPSPSSFYYPKSSDRRSELGPCDVAIYHYSYAWVWLRRDSLSRCEKRQIVNFHNIESDLFQLRAKQDSFFLTSWIHRMNAWKLRRHEKALAESGLEIWHISPMDFQQFGSTYSVSGKQQLVTPIYAREIQHASKLKSDTLTSNYSILGFIGGMSFEPNRASLEWIIQKLCPELKRMKFNGEIRVVGKGAPPELLDEAASYEFFKYLGYVESLEEFWTSLSFMLIPHIVGSGVRIKLLDALASRIPVVANSQAVDRIHPALQKSEMVFVSDSAEDWAKWICEHPGRALRDQMQTKEVINGLRLESVYPPEFWNGERS